MSWLAALADKAFGFKGRLRRRDWWLIGITVFVVQMILSEIIIVSLFGSEQGMIAAIADPASVPPVSLAQSIVATLTTLPMLWVGFATTIKRFHDRDDSSLWNVVALILLYSPTLLMTFVAPFIGSDEQIMTVSNVLGIISLPPTLYVVVVAGILDGTPGPNRYGPSPKGLEFTKVSE